MGTSVCWSHEQTEDGRISGENSAEGCEGVDGPHTSFCCLEVGGCWSLSGADPLVHGGLTLQRPRVNY